MKKSFVLYKSQRGVFEILRPKECKELILAIFDFSDGIERQLPPKSKIAFISIKDQLQRDFDKWEANSEMRKEFGKLGGLAKASKSNLKPDLLSKPAVDVDVDVDVINKENNNSFSQEKKTKEPIAVEEAWQEMEVASANARKGVRP